MFDRVAAEDTLYRISRQQIVLFLNGPDKADVYGAGFFCDACAGTVYLVANTERYYWDSLRELEARCGQTDSEAFRWDIGNWKYPGGLFPSSSAEQEEFDAGWRTHEEALSQIENAEQQRLLEDICFQVLTRLASEGAFVSASSLKGLIVLGPEDSETAVIEKTKPLDGLLRQSNRR